MSTLELLLPVRGGVQCLRLKAWPGGGPHLPDLDDAYVVITLAANSCLCAGCVLLLPVLDSCLRPTPASWGLLVCGTRAVPVR